MTEQPHDHLVRGVFGQPERAAAELRSVLPSAVRRALDWPTLARVAGTFIDPALRHREVDLLFSVRARGGSPALVYLLFEHQSAPDPWLPLRLLDYQVRIWEAWRRDQPDAPRLPPIVPVVLYHGERPWRGSTRFSDLIEPWPAAARAGGEIVAGGYGRLHEVDFDFALDDLTRCSDRDLDRRALDEATRLTLLALKHVRTTTDLKATLLAWAGRMTEAARAPGGRETLLWVLRYVSVVRESVGREFILRELGPRLEPEAQEVAMKTLAQEWIEEGIEKGIEEGIERGIERGVDQGQRALLLRQLELRFGALPDWARDRLEAATRAQLEQYAVQVLVAPTLEEALVR